jgi:hypothetical protein
VKSRSPQECKKVQWGRAGRDAPLSAFIKTEDGKNAVQAIETAEEVF